MLHHMTPHHSASYAAQWAASEVVSHLDQVHVVGETSPVASLNEQHVSLQVDESYVDFCPQLVVHIHVHVATQDTCAARTRLLHYVQLKTPA